MDTSILYSIKTFLGLTIDNCAFDAQIIIYINMALNILRQLGVGEEDGDIVRITGMEEVWSEFIGSQEQYLEMTKSYVGLSTRLLFDPPTNSFIVSAIQSSLNELLWRISVEVDERRSQYAS